jgi:hypothetical protein
MFIFGNMKQILTASNLIGVVLAVRKAIAPEGL